MADPIRIHLTVAAAPAHAPDGEHAGTARDLLQVGDLAKLSGKTVRAIHHYEELGLIEPVGRSKGHYRLFDPETLVRIRWISKLKTLGLSLNEIRGLVQLRQSSPSAMRSHPRLRSVFLLTQAHGLRVASRPCSPKPPSPLLTQRTALTRRDV